MNLGCLPCHNQSLQRVSSQRELAESYDREKSSFKLCWSKVERSWSGNLMASEVVRRIKKGHHRVHSTTSLELESSTPRLVRSPGMRRDWSFEDLRQIRSEEMQPT